MTFTSLTHMAARSIPGIFTVRSTSTRLPEKCFLPFGDYNVLTHIVRRARMYDIDPIICTSVDPSDDGIERLAAAEGAKCFRGSLSNKLKRWSDCAKKFKLESFHTVDADDPFFDGDEMHRSMKLLADQKLDMVKPTEASSAGAATVGYSLVADIVHRASAGLKDDDDTEMMWYYVEKLPNLRTAVLPDLDPLPPKSRLTLDYQEDYWLLESIRRIVGGLASRPQVDDLLTRNPDFHKINWFRNEEWKAGQLAKKV